MEFAHFVVPKVGEYANHWALRRNPFGVDAEYEMAKPPTLPREEGNLQRAPNEISPKPLSTRGWVMNGQDRVTLLSFFSAMRGGGLPSG